jgi:hypothetical protein
MLALVVRRGPLAILLVSLAGLALFAASAVPQSMTPRPRSCDIPRFEDSKLVRGTTRADNIRGGERSEVIKSRAGNDRVHGAGGADCLDGGPGADRLTGGSGRDRIIGGRGNDIIVGGAGDDTIYCGAGHDVAYFSPRDKAFECERGVHSTP